MNGLNLEKKMLGVQLKAKQKSKRYYNLQLSYIEDQTESNRCIFIFFFTKEKAKIKMFRAMEDECL